MNQIDNELLGKNDEIGEALRQKGCWHGQILSNELALALLQYAQTLRNAQRFQPAAIGANHQTLVVDSIRGDETYWLAQNTPQEVEFLAVMLSLKTLFESYFPIPLNNFEGHFSYYPVGTHYKTHWDNSKGRNSRILSVVNYLNPHWQNGDGGELVLYEKDSSSIVQTIEPKFATTAIFFSEDFPHQVLTTNKERFSLTGWFHQRS